MTERPDPISQRPDTLRVVNPAPSPHPFDRPVRTVLLAGDLHANVDWARRVLSQVLGAGDPVTGLRFDTVVQVGDFGFDPDAGGFLDEIEEVAWAHELVVLALDGNHDSQPWLDTIPADDRGLRWVRPHVAHVPRAARWVWAGKAWGALGGAPSVDGPWRERGVDWWPNREQATDAEVDSLVAGGRLDVLVTHDAPALATVAHPRRYRSDFPMNQELRDECFTHARRLERAMRGTQAPLVVHGHWHRAVDVAVHHAHGSTRVVGLACDGTRRASAFRVWRDGELGDAAELGPVA